MIQYLLPLLLAVPAVAVTSREGRTVSAYLDALARGDASTMERLWAPDAKSIRADGSSRPVDRIAMRDARAFERAMHTTWSYRIESADGPEVTVHEVERNDLYDALGSGGCTQTVVYQTAAERIETMRSQAIRYEGVAFRPAVEDFEKWLLTTAARRDRALLHDGHLRFDGRSALHLRPWLVRWQAQRRHVRGYDVDLRLDKAAKSVAGRETITMSAGFGRLLLPLRGQTVHGVRIAGRPATFATSNDALAVDLEDGPQSVSIDYSAVAPKGIVFTPSVDYSGFDTCTWMLCDDRPAVRAPVAMSLHAPPNEWTLATGRLTAVDADPDGGRVFRWRDAAPRPAYLYGFAIGRLRAASTIDDGTILEVVSADAGQEQLAGVLRHTAGMAAFFEGIAGQTLPRHRYTQLIVAGSAAQEKSTFSIIGTDQLAALATDPTEDWIIAHEMAHQFWGNLVTPRTWSDMWLSEGMVTFLTAAWKERRWGRAAYEREMRLARERVKFAVDAGYDVPLAWRGDYPSLRIQRAIAYSRGALFLDLLRQRLGETRFWPAIRRFTRRHAGQSVTSRAFEDVVGGPRRLFREWVGPSAAR